MNTENLGPVVAELKRIADAQTGLAVNSHAQLRLLQNIVDCLKTEKFTARDGTVLPARSIAEVAEDTSIFVNEVAEALNGLFVNDTES